MYVIKNITRLESWVRTSLYIHYFSLHISGFEFIPVKLYINYPSLDILISSVQTNQSLYIKYSGLDIWWLGFKPIKRSSNYLGLTVYVIKNITRLKSWVRISLYIHYFSLHISGLEFIPVKLYINYLSLDILMSWVQTNQSLYIKYSGLDIWWLGFKPIKRSSNYLELTVYVIKNITRLESWVRISLYIH